MKNLALSLVTTLILVIPAAVLHAAEQTPKGLRHVIGPFVKPLKQAKISADDKPKADLGRMLFYDTRLSDTGTLSCNSCHDLAAHGANGSYAQKLREEEKLKRDVPSIYNKHGMTLFDWDGRHKTIAEKTKAAITSESELNVKQLDTMIKRLSKVEGYAPLFAKAFPDQSDAITVDNVVSALVTFQSGLATPAPIDKFIQGDDSALTEEQIRGGYLFDQHNCAACHTGTNFGGQMLQKLGTTRPWPNQTDAGHYLVSGDPSHRMVFRVAPLRNLSKTPPYFHDGSSRRVWHAIKRMAEYEVGRPIPVKEVLSMQAFLETLSGEIPTDYIKKPELPQ